MSSAVVSTSAAWNRHFIFDEESEPAGSPSPLSQSSRVALDRTAPSTALRAGLGDCPYIKSPARDVQTKINCQKSAIPLTPASRLEIRPAPEMVSSGIAAMDALTGGLPRGCITEICGPASSGRTSVLLAALAATTRRGEFCALIDASDALDPHSVAAAGVDLDRLLWVRCGDSSPQRHRDTEKNSKKQNPRECIPSRSKNSSQDRRGQDRLEQVLHAADLLLESGGFGLIALDLADVPPESARRIPLTTWFRFRRAIEHTPTILLAIEPQPIAGSCSSLLLQLSVPGTQYPVPSSKPSHSHLLFGLEITAELIRSRLDRKPARSVAFTTKTAWVG